MPKACVIYARVSTAEQAAPGHHSLDAQEGLCRRYAEGQSFHVVEVIRDEGYSGRTIQRPGLKRLYEYTGNTPPGSISAILVQDTSRVGRDTTEYLLFRRQLQQKGIELVAVTQPNIDASPEGRLVDTVMAAINQYQSEEKARRVTIAMQKKFDDGWFPGWAPLGYSNVERDEHHVIEPDPERFELISLAFREYASGHYAQESLLRLLTKKGLRDRHGRLLSRISFNQLLANPFYWGLLRWNGQERPGKHPPATDRSIWDRCQAVTAAHNRYVSRERKHAFLLTGLTVCGACGNRHTQSVIARKHKRYYNCKSQAKCAQPFIPTDHLEGQVGEIVAQVRLSEEFIARVVEKVREVFARRSAAHETQLKNLLRRRTVLEQKRATAEQKLLAGVLSDGAFRRLTAQITHELDEVTRDLEIVEATRRPDMEALADVLRFARDFPTAYAQAPPPVKRRYLEFFFQAFVVQDRTISRTVPTEFFQALLEAQKVQTRPNWYPRLNTIRTLLRVLSERAWLDKLRQLTRDAGTVAA